MEKRIYKRIHRWCAWGLRWTLPFYLGYMALVGFMVLSDAMPHVVQYMDELYARLSHLEPTLATFVFGWPTATFFLLCIFYVKWMSGRMVDMRAEQEAWEDEERLREYGHISHE